MTTHNVADAKANLPQLIDRALAGQEIVITRHGKPVAELRPTVRAPRKGAGVAYELLIAGRTPYVPGRPNSVELLNVMYEEPE
jgi:antitoxin (DNA-binding transcriptional repressor) of toxin-antitoxin stability system